MAEYPGYGYGYYAPSIPVTASAPVSAAPAAVVQSTSTSSGGYIAVIIFVVIIILIIIGVGFFFFGGSTIVSQTTEFFGANYAFADNTSTNVPTAGNFIYIIPNSTTTASSVTVTSNTLNQPGRTFLIKNDSPNTVTIMTGPGVTLYDTAGNKVTSDVLITRQLAEYISNSTNPGTEFRRLL